MQNDKITTLCIKYSISKMFTALVTSVQRLKKVTLFLVYNVESSTNELLLN